MRKIDFNRRLQKFCETLKNLFLYHGEIINFIRLESEKTTKNLKPVHWNEEILNFNETDYISRPAFSRAEVILHTFPFSNESQSIKVGSSVIAWGIYLERCLFLKKRCGAEKWWARSKFKFTSNSWIIRSPKRTGVAGKETQVTCADCFNEFLFRFSSKFKLWKLQLQLKDEKHIFRWKVIFFSFRKLSRRLKLEAWKYDFSLRKPWIFNSLCKKY